MNEEEMFDEPLTDTGDSSTIIIETPVMEERTPSDDPNEKLGGKFPDKFAPNVGKGPIILEAIETLKNAMNGTGGKLVPTLRAVVQDIRENEAEIKAEIERGITRGRL